MAPAGNTQPATSDHESRHHSAARGPPVTAFGRCESALRTLVALRALRDAGELDRMRVSVVLTGDEELPGSPLLSARADLVSAAEGSAAALGFEDGDGDPPLAPSDGNRKLFAMLDQASRDLGLGGLEPVDPARAGAADVSFLAGRVPMIVDALGLKGSGGHTVNERANLRTLAWQAKRVAVTLSRIAAAK